MRPGRAAQSSTEAQPAAQVERGRAGLLQGGGPGLRDNLRTPAPQYLVLTALRFPSPSGIPI